MAGKTPPSRPQKASVAEARDARLKAALKSNMARRKAQARARGDQNEPAAEKSAAEQAESKEQ